LAISGTDGASTLARPSASLIASAAGRISEQWNGAETGSAIARFTPGDRPGGAGNHHLAAAIVVGDLDGLRPRRPAVLGLDHGRFLADRARLIEIDPDQRRHAALAGRHRLLHRHAAQTQQARGVGDAQAAGGGQRGIFPERMARHHGGLVGQHQPALALQHPQHRERHRHQRRLRVLGQGELLDRAGEHQLGELLLQRVVDLLEHGAGGRERGREVPSHAGELASLTREDEGVHGHQDAIRLLTGASSGHGDRSSAAAPTRTAAPGTRGVR
jgi:hypothetical protein